MLKSIAQNPPGPRGRRIWPWFMAWVPVEALYSFGLLSFLLLGRVGVAIAVVLTVLLVCGAQSRQGSPGLLAGLGLPLCYVAFLNRNGPGVVCSSIPGGTNCTQESNSLVWLGVALVFLAVAAALFCGLNRQGALHSSGETHHPDSGG
jgi:hypothetical protein